MHQQTDTFDLSEVRHIDRVSIGSLNPLAPESEGDMQAKLDKINCLLSGNPKGLLIAKDISFKIVRVGEHTLVCQQVSYHIGFKRKPLA